MNPPTPGKHEATAADADAGYQWKQIFLPEGTRLRACFGRVPYFAIVKGAEIKFGEQTVTPSGFANLRGSGSGSGNRNAWKAVWLRFPGNEQWVLADVCRSKQKIAIARLFGAADAIAMAAPAAVSLAKPPRQAKQRKRAAAPPQPTPCEVFNAFIVPDGAKTKRSRRLKTPC